MATIEVLDGTLSWEERRSLAMLAEGDLLESLSRDTFTAVRAAVASRADEDLLYKMVASELNPIVLRALLDRQTELRRKRRADEDKKIEESNNKRIAMNGSIEEQLDLVQRASPETLKVLGFSAFRKVRYAVVRRADKDLLIYLGAKTVCSGTYRLITERLKALSETENLVKFADIEPSHDSAFISGRRREIPLQSKPATDTRCQYCEGKDGYHYLSCSMAAASVKYSGFIFKNREIIARCDEDEVEFFAMGSLHILNTPKDPNAEARVAALPNRRKPEISILCDLDMMDW